MNIERTEESKIFTDNEIKIEVGDLLSCNIENTDKSIKKIYKIYDGYVSYGNACCDLKDLIDAIKKGQYLLFKKQVVSKPKEYEITEIFSYFEKPLDGYFYSIKTLERLADGLFFSVGEVLGGGGTIHSFEIDKGDLIVKINTVQGDGTWRSNLASLTKAKKTFKVEDGEAFEGEDGYAVHPQSSFGWSIIPDWKISLNVSSKVKQFKSKEKAEDYILHNKPTLTLEDVLNVCNKIQFHNRSDRQDESDYNAVYVDVLLNYLTSTAKYAIQAKCQRR